MVQMIIKLHSHLSTNNRTQGCLHKLQNVKTILDFEVTWRMEHLRYFFFFANGDIAFFIHLV